MSKQEVLPPVQPLTPVVRRPANVEVTVSTPRVDPGDFIDSTLTRWQAERHARTINALTVRTQAEAALFVARTALVENYVQQQRAAFVLQELPEALANELACRRVERAEALRQAQHKYEVAELKRLGEIAHGEAALVDAQQALKAQREHGYTTYELAWKKKHVEMLDIELSAAERRAILDEHTGRLGNRNGETLGVTYGHDEGLDDALYEARAQLAASGLDTGRIDAVIEKRRPAKFGG